MLYPKSFPEKIDFERIKELVCEECAGQLGIAFVERMRFWTRHDVVKKLLGQTEEFRQILLSGDYFPTGNFLDVSTALQKAKVLGNYLSEEEFQDIRLSLETLRGCLKFFEEQPEEAYTELRRLTEQVEFNTLILKEIEKVIDERGKMRDNASPQLREIRMRISSAESRLRRQLDQILRNLKNQGLIEGDTMLTIREGRMVIPLRAEHKRRLKGFIHDTSTSGQTLFIEPEESLEINNEIRELNSEERREIIRILTNLTNILRPEIPALEKAYHFLGMIDFIRAKARFALNFDAVHPELSSTPALNWENARHPLLEITLKNQHKTIAPLYIKLDNENRILLISGPNAGGKSVCLKTVALLQFMLQSGLLVPVNENSVFGIFETLCIDIGDEQSLENDLSTYSSHLKNMKHSLQFANEKSLCLVDEFGTGTDPDFGGIIAEVILEKLNEKKTYGVITTHYTNLKIFAEKTKGIINGAMRYDVEKLEPLFQLEIGKPGSSFALEIAQKIGLPREVVKLSRERLGQDKVQMEKLLKSLEQERKAFYDKNMRLKKEKRDLEQTLEKYNTLKEKFETKRQDLMNEARREAKQVLAEANQKIEHTIREIRETQAEKERTKTLRKELQDFDKTIKKPVFKKEPKPEVKVTGGTIQVGDFVKLKDSETIGEVLEIKGKDVKIQIGALRSNIKLKRLVKISKKDFTKSKKAKSAPSTKGINLTVKMQNFTHDLDIRGQRPEEVIPKLVQFLDDAIMLGAGQVRIVHGKGTGVLRQTVRSQLRHYRQVIRVSDEHADRGGAGVTLVSFDI